MKMDFIKVTMVLSMGLGLLACGDNEGAVLPRLAGLDVPLTVQSVTSVADSEKTDAQLVYSRGLKLEQGNYTLTPIGIGDLAKDLFILEMVGGFGEESCFSKEKVVDDEVALEVRDDECQIDINLIDSTGAVVLSDDWDLELR